ncbi:MAG: TerC family protein, partial [Candidatus Methylomirabilales bacterium]
MEHSWMWILFVILIVGSLTLDLAIFHRKAQVISPKKAALWSVGWVSLAILFGAGIFFTEGSEKGIEFLTGYLIEWSLSVDNLFVFLVIFTYFGVPATLQHRVLFWGILGALVMRGVFIILGVTLLAHFHWVSYALGIFLVYTGIRLARQSEKELQPDQNLFVRLARRLFPVTPTYEGERFFTTRDGQRWATPLFIVLVCIEATDLAFAVDSIPAILAITRDPFIVYTSNVFAILGLRALYFVLAAIMDLFRFLRYGLSIVLVFVGVKMLLADAYPIPALVSLGVIACVLIVSVLASIVVRPTKTVESKSNPKPLKPPGLESGTETSP